MRERIAARQATATDGSFPPLNDSRTRGLRAILESTTLDIMFSLPEKAERFGICQIDAGVIRGENEPTFVESEKRESA